MQAPGGFSLPSARSSRASPSPKEFPSPSKEEEQLVGDVGRARAFAACSHVHPAGQCGSCAAAPRMLSALSAGLCAARVRAGGHKQGGLRVVCQAHHQRDRELPGLQLPWRRRQPSGARRGRTRGHLQHGAEGALLAAGHQLRLCAHTLASTHPRSAAVWHAWHTGAQHAGGGGPAVGAQLQGALHHQQQEAPAARGGSGGR